MAPTSKPLWRTILGAAWAALFGGVLVLMFLKLHETASEGYRGLTLLRVAVSLPVIVATFVAAKFLMGAHRVFVWKPSDLLPWKLNESLLVLALRTRFIGPVVAALLLMNLPTIAMLEEYLFRQGTAGWQGAIWRSLAFGLAHLTMNVPLGASLAVGGTGLWFSYWYFRGGIELSGAMHLAYILPIVALSLLGFLLETIKSRRP